MLNVRINLYKVLPPFLFTFFVAVTVVSLFGYFGFGKLAANSYDFETKQKIYAILVKDAQNKQDRIDKNKEYAKSKSFYNLDPIVFTKGYVDLAVATNEIDTKQAPDDFERAWRNYAKAQTKVAKTLSNMPEPSQFKIDSVEAKNWNNAVSEELESWSEVVLIAKSNGINFDQYENFIKD